MWYVYILRSEKQKNWIYIGSTNNLQRRLTEHLTGLSLTTKRFLPVYLEAYIAVKSDRQARGLEKYFKAGSGKVILRKRILTDEARWRRA